LRDITEFFLLHLGSIVIIHGRVLLGIHNRFIYKSTVSDRELRRHFERGRSVLVIAMCFLFATLLARQVLATLEQGLLIRMSQEALLIPGWVTLWEPAYILSPAGGRLSRNEKL